MVLASAHTVLVDTAAFLLMAPECGSTKATTLVDSSGGGAAADLESRMRTAPQNYLTARAPRFQALGRLYLWRSKLVRLASVIAHHSTML